MELDISPVDGMVDERTVVRVKGGPPDTQVEVSAVAQDMGGIVWTSKAVVLTNESGAATVGDGPPLSGTFHEADTSGVVWGMVPADRKASSYWTPVTHGFDFSVSATTLHPDQPEATPETAQATATRRYVDPDVKVFEVRESDVMGTLFEPPGGDRTSGAIIVPGLFHSDFVARQVGGLLATRGITSFVVEYHGVEGTPAEINSIPLETFAAGFDFLFRHPRVDRRLVGAVGFDRGAEALLALVSMSGQQPRALVVVSPSCVAWQASSTSGKAPDASSWTWREKPVPFMKLKSSGMVGQKLLKKVNRKGSNAIKLLPSYTESLRDPQTFGRCMFPIERYPGPICFLGGSDDQVWPTADMIELMWSRRRNFDANLEDQQRLFEGAGHGIRFPHLPTTVEQFQPPSGPSLELGGDPAASALAARECWAKILDFLEIHLGGLRVGH